MNIKLNLKRTVYGGRKAYTIESIEEEGRKVDDVLVRSPDGDFHLTVGDTDYARNYPRIYQSLLESTTEWEGTDSITMGNLP